MSLNSIPPITRLEKELSIPKDFLLNLLFEEKNDWSFIIKLHSLIESAVSYLLTKTFGRNELSDVFSSLELGNKKHGKLVFLSSLNLIPKEYRRFISSLSELRNKIVHDVKNVTFNFEAYINSLDTRQLKIFVKDFTAGADAQITIGNKTASREVFAKENPRLVVYLSALFCLEWIYYSKEEAELKLEKDSLKEQLYNLWVNRNKGKNKQDHSSTS